MASKGKGKNFVDDLRCVLLSLLPQYRILSERVVPWHEQLRGKWPESFWPKADLFIEKANHQFIIEYDENSDPGRSLVKYWPYFDSREAPVTIIAVWKRGNTYGFTYGELAKWIGKKLEKLYPWFHYEFIERTDEVAKVIAQKIANIVREQ